MAAAAETLLAELLEGFGGKEPRLEENAVPDMAEGTRFLVERPLRTRVPREEKQEGPARHGGKERLQAPAVRKVIRRLPAGRG